MGLSGKVLKNIDLKPSQRKLVMDLLRRHLPGVEAWAYGSRVKFSSRPNSDLDMVVFATPEQKGYVANLAEAFEESDLPFRVDLFIWDEVPERFHKNIQRERVVLQSGERNHLSGVAATGKGWERLNLGEIAEIIMGQSPKSEFYNTSAEGLPFLQGSAEFGNMFPSPKKFTSNWKREAEADSILLSVRAPVGDMNIADAKYAIGRGLASIKGKENNTRFIFYLLKHNAAALNNHASGTVFASINKASLENFECVVPPLPEQRAIAHILGTLDDKIELNRRMSETLEAMAQALFKSWFIDFDPVHAKAAGRDTGLPKHIADLFPDAFDGDGLPTGWQLSEIGKEVNVVGGGTPSTKEPVYWDEGEHCWATPKDLSKLLSPVLLDTERKLTAIGVDKISSGLLPKGSVLLSSRAPIGYLAIAEAPTAINQGFIGMICESRLSNLYVLAWCQENLEYLKSIASGSVFAELSKRAFKPTPITVPSPEVLEVWEHLTRPWHEKLVSCIRKCSALTTIRDSLLPNLISGTVRPDGQDHNFGVAQCQTTA